MVAAVEAEGERLRAEFHLPDGPRGRRGNAPIDAEIEGRLRASLQQLLPCAFTGEETGTTASGKEPRFVWLVDPQDGTFDFISGKRGSAIAVALLRDRVPVLGVVHSPLSPDLGADTIAWAEGGSLQRNGRELDTDLSHRRLASGALVWATASSALRPATFSRAVAPARYVAMPSIAYRLARVAAGDGVAAISVHDVNEYDIAAGLALIRAAGGVMLDGKGREVALSGTSETRISGCFAGAPEAVFHLTKQNWALLEEEPRRNVRISLGYPRRDDPVRLSRAQGCLLGQVIGDSLGSLVELKSAADIARLHPGGVRELADGGVYHTIAGQPTDDSELALTLARNIVGERGFFPEKILAAYRDWLTTRPIDVGVTTERGLLGLHTAESESNGSLMRVSPLGVWAAGDPARAARAAREDSALTHPNPVCVEACAGYCAAIAAGVAGASRAQMLEAALAHSSGPAREAIARNAPPESFGKNMGWVLIALQNAFYCLSHSLDFESALVTTISWGGDTDTNAAIAGALLGAAHGREAIPPRWILPVLACRALAEAGAPRPRPIELWPDDVLELAEALVFSL